MGRLLGSILILPILSAGAGVFAAGFDGPARNDQPASVKERLLKEGPPAWEGWKTYLGQAEACVTVSERGLGKTAAIKPLTHENYRLLSNGPRVQLRRPLEGDNNKVLTYSVNEQYAFLLDQASPGSPYVVKYLESDAREVFESIDGRVLQYVNASWEFWGKPLGEFFSEPNFVFKEVAAVNEGGKSLVRVTFDYKWDENLDIGPLQGGWFLLSPENHWSVERSEIRVGKPGTVVSTVVCAVEYGDADGAYKKPKKVTIRGSNDQSGNAVETVCLVENWEHKEIAPSRFRLAAFDLPEAIAKSESPVTSSKAASDSVMEIKIDPVSVMLQPEEVQLTPAKVVNPLFQDIRIVGLVAVCNAQACVGVADLPVVIPARGSGTISVRATAWTTPGKFRHVIILYTDSAVYPRVQLTVEGEVMAPDPNEPR